MGPETCEGPDVGDAPIGKAETTLRLFGGVGASPVAPFGTPLFQDARLIGLPWPVALPLPCRIGRHARRTDDTDEPAHIEPALG